MPDRDLGGPEPQSDSPGLRTWAGRRPSRSSPVALLLALALLAGILGSMIVMPLPTTAAAGTDVVSAASQDCPTAGCPTADPQYPTVFYGATPAQPDGGTSKPVLLFVHGLQGRASDWWSNGNDMYSTAWNAGYRTAFVQLTPLDPISGTALPEADTFANGITLTQQIITATQHYGVPWLDVIGHSKGGVDAQTAIVYDGAASYVHNLITLASPHHGTPLADLVCGNPSLTQSLGLTAGPGLCGSPAPSAVSATCAVTSVPLCTGGLMVAEMNAYRAQTDAMTPTAPVTYFVGAGSDWQDFSYVSYIGGTLQSQDSLNDNDGLVPVESACSLPGANYLFVMPFNHYNIFFGHNSFPFIDLVERGGGTVNRNFYTAPYSGTNGGPGPGPCAFNNGGGTTLPSAAARTALNGGGIVQSGRLTSAGAIAATLPIESRAQLASLHLLVSGPRVGASLIDPAGRAHALPAPSKSGTPGDVLAGAWQVNYQTTMPARGTWRLALKGPAKAAYLLIMGVTSPLQVTLDGLPEGALVRPGTTLTLRASANEGQVRATVERLSFTVTGLGRAALARQSVGTRSAVFHVPTTPQIMTLTATVTGKTADGSMFQRSFIRSLAVVPAAGRHGIPQRK